MCLAVTCHRHFWQNDQDLLHAIVVPGGGTNTKIRVSTENYPEKKKSCRSSGHSNPGPFGKEKKKVYISDDVGHAAAESKKRKRWGGGIGGTLF